MYIDLEKQENNKAWKTYPSRKKGCTCKVKSEKSVQAD